MQEERERRKRKKEWKRVQPRPLYFLELYTFHKPQFFLSFGLCVWEEEKGKECRFAVSAGSVPEVVFNILACKDFSQLKKV